MAVKQLLESEECFNCLMQNKWFQSRVKENTITNRPAYPQTSYVWGGSPNNMQHYKRPNLSYNPQMGIQVTPDGRVIEHFTTNVRKSFK